MALQLGSVPVEIDRALNAFPEDDERHWEVQAFLFNMLAHKAQTRADAIKRQRQRTKQMAQDASLSTTPCKRCGAAAGQPCTSD